MTTPPGGQIEPTRIKVYESPHVLVEISGTTEAAVLRRSAEWLETFDGAVLVLAANWRGDVSEDADPSLYRMDLTVDMSIAVDESRWPRDWFKFPGGG